MKATILVVDDEPAIRVALERLLNGRGHTVETAASGEQALRYLEQRSYQLVVTDLTLGSISGMDVLAWIRQQPEPPPTIMITAYGSERTAVEAIKLGAIDYLAKPFDNDELVLVVERALEEGRLRRDLHLLREEVGERYKFHNILGKSSAMQDVFSRIRKVADTDLAVLIRGPSGTGKELVANAIHYNSGPGKSSGRRQRPLIKVNCAAFSTELVESELFGHEQGSFTGATRSRQGKFELADGGSLFLDEIGDMPLDTQAKVLRVLQNQAFERVGGNRTLKVDVRILAATNQDLEALIEAGKFRQDLFYRLSVVPVELPSLAQRPEDIPLLAEHFLAIASKRLQRPPKALSADAFRALTRHSWPGNVRELEHAIEHAVALASGDEIEVEDLPSSLLRAFRGQASQGGGAQPTKLSLVTSVNFKEAKQQTIDAFEREFITEALHRHQGNITHAADETGMYRQQLQVKVAKLGLDPDDYR